MSDEDLAYVLRCQSKRTDIPIDVVRTLSEAYAEIISLRQLLGNTEELRKERDELRQQVENIKNGFEGGCYLCEVVGEMNKRLQKERDEARRDVCYAEVNGQYGRRYKPQDIAKIKNWDCFTKDKTP
jgi:hypothetical protein